MNLQEALRFDAREPDRLGVVKTMAARLVQAADEIGRLERELAVEREITAHLTQAIEQSPRPAEVRRMRKALESSP